jgi:uncharacterized membrane protein YgcG
MNISRVFGLLSGSVTAGFGVFLLLEEVSFWPITISLVGSFIFFCSLGIGGSSSSDTTITDTTSSSGSSSGGGFFDFGGGGGCDFGGGDSGGGSCD